MNSRTYRIVIIICLILVVVGSIFAVSQLRSGGGGNAKPTPTPTPVTFAGQEDGEFTMTVQGPIVANELFHSSTITVSASNRTFTAYTTYDNVVSANTTFGNNLEAYQQFATAMQNAGYSKVSTEKGTQKDAGSTCPNGRRYTYTFTAGGQTTVNSWSSTCNTKTQTMVPASASQIIQLMKAQIPNISTQPGYQPFPF